MRSFRCFNPTCLWGRIWKINIALKHAEVQWPKKKILFAILTVVWHIKKPPNNNLKIQVQRCNPFPEELRTEGWPQLCIGQLCEGLQTLLMSCCNRYRITGWSWVWQWAWLTESKGRSTAAHVSVHEQWEKCTGEQTFFWLLFEAW